MWKLWHWLFGWDYVQWSNCADQGVARVHRAYDGRVYYWRYRVPKVADVVAKPEQVLWLTCPPSKYMLVAERKEEVLPLKNL